MTRIRRLAAISVALAALASGAYATNYSRSADAEESRSRRQGAALTAGTALADSAGLSIAPSVHMGPYREPEDGSADFMQHVWNH